MSKRQAVIKGENRDLSKRQENGEWQHFQADKGGDEGSNKANSLENKTYKQAGKETPRKQTTDSAQHRHGTKTTDSAQHRHGTKTTDSAQHRHGKRRLENRLQTAHSIVMEPRLHRAVISINIKGLNSPIFPILLLSLRISNCIRVNIQLPATHSNNPKT